MTLIATAPGAMVFAGTDAARAEVLAAARDHLLGLGVHHLEVDEVLVDRPGLVVTAHWAGDKVGFCGPDHPDAVAVTVVNLPIPPEGTAHVS